MKNNNGGTNGLDMIKIKEYRWFYLQSFLNSFLFKENLMLYFHTLGGYKKTPFTGTHWKENESGDYGYCS